MFCFVAVADAGPGYKIVSGGGVPVAGCAGGSDGAIGYSTGYTDAATVNEGFWIKMVTPSEDGTVTYIHAEIGYCNGCTVNAGIYTSDGSTKLADGVATQTGTNGSAEVFDFELDSAVCLVAATNYRLVVMTSGDTAVSARYAGTGIASTGYNASSSPAFGDDLPSSVTNTLDNARNFKIWADNTP